MQRFISIRPSLVCASLALAFGSHSALAQVAGGVDMSTAQRLEGLQRQLDEQKLEIERLRGQVSQQQTRDRPADGAAQQDQAADGGAAGEAPRMVHVGVAPPEQNQPPAVAPIFDQPGILTQPGSYVLEPSLQYGYSSSNRVALVGYTIIPALLIGLVDVREVKRNTLTAALTGRWGLTKRLEAEIKLPYVYRSDSTISREINAGSASDRVFDSSGRHIGDVELALRYQLNQPGPDRPYLIGGLRFKSRTGKDPFEVVTDCVTRCVGSNVTGTGEPMDLPTGSGFYSLQPSLTWLMASDPVVFFGGISYTHNFKRSNVSRQVLNGEKEFIGSVKPGDVIGLNFGMGMALNDRSSFSIGVDLNTVGRTKQNGERVASSVRTQLSSLLLGYSYRLTSTKTLNVSVGAGLTRDTPDLTLTVRLPMTF